MDYYEPVVASKRSAEIYKRLTEISKGISKAQIQAARNSLDLLSQKRQRDMSQINESVKHQKTLVDERTSRLSQTQGEFNKIYKEFAMGQKFPSNTCIEMDMSPFYPKVVYLTIKTQDKGVPINKLAQTLALLQQLVPEFEQKLADQELAIKQAQDLLSTEKSTLEALEKEKNALVKQAMKEDEDAAEKARVEAYGDVYREFEALRKEWDDGAGYRCGKCHRVERINGNICYFTTSEHYNSTDYGGYYTCSQHYPYH